MIKCNFIGRLGADAETVDGEYGQFLKFRVATDDYDRKAKENVTTWVNVRINAERVGNMKLTKGSLVFITGTLKTSMYQTKAGESAVSIDIAADSVNYVRGAGSGSTQSDATVVTVEKEDVSTGKFTKKVEVVAEAASAEPEDDLPFLGRT